MRIVLFLSLFLLPACDPYGNADPGGEMAAGVLGVALTPVLIFGGAPPAWEWE